MRVTSLYDNSDVSDDEDSQFVMSSSPSSRAPPSPLPAELQALLARERSRRRAAEDWATFLVATLDAYVRASHAYERRFADSGRGRSRTEGEEKTCDCRQLGNPSRITREIMSLLSTLAV